MLLMLLAFLHSWRCRPNLTINLAMLSQKADDEELSGIIDRILRNHSGIGLKTLELNLGGEESTFPYVDSWLQVAVTPGIEVLDLRLYKKYNFTCWLLSDGVRNSIRDLHLGTCVFCPTSELGPLRRLTRLDLSSVYISGDQLECILSYSLTLEELELYSCKGILCLKIPCVLQQLSRLTVFYCYRLQAIECKAPKLSIIDFSGEKIKLSLGQPLQIKELHMDHPNVICYARAELPSIMPNLETLLIASHNEVVNTPMLLTKFLYLKHLTIQFRNRTFYSSYDFFLWFLSLTRLLPWRLCSWMYLGNMRSMNQFWEVLQN